MLQFLTAWVELLPEAARCTQFIHDTRHEIDVGIPPVLDMHVTRSLPMKYRVIFDIEPEWRVGMRTRPIHVSALSRGAVQGVSRVLGIIEFSALLS